MMRLAAWSIGSLAAAALAGYAAAEFAPPATPSVVERASGEIHAVHAGRAIAAAAFDLRTLHAPPPPALVDEGQAAPPPPEPDIGAAFRRDLSAIVRDKRRFAAIIIDPSARTGRRVLHVGSVYRNGWKVRAVSETTVELRRRRDVRVVSVFAPPTDEIQDLAGDGAPRLALSRDAPASTQKDPAQ